jgi:hypothetical protein
MNLERRRAMRFFSSAVVFVSSCSLGFIVNAVVVSRFSDQLFKTHYPVLVGLLLSSLWFLSEKKIASNKSAIVIGTFYGFIIGAPSVYLTYVIRYFIEGMLDKSFGNIVKSAGWVIWHYQVASVFLLSPFVGAASFLVGYWLNGRFRTRT